MNTAAGKTFRYRGFMLDSVRHFLPAEDVRKLIRAAALCGINRMHWHLTDDQGWRIEILRYPQLTETGARRGESFFGGVNTLENNSGYYTQDEIRKTVRFAKEYGIEIIPEIELPGHASALLAACPEYGCRRETGENEGNSPETAPWSYRVEVSGGIFPNLICAGKESTIRFIEDVLDEVTALFPYPMVHIGGDEALKLHWRRCPDCRRRMRKLGLKTEDELQYDLVLRIGSYLAEKGRQTVVWNDVLNGGILPGNFIVQQWMGGEELTRKFMEQGGQVICSDIQIYYFDYPYGQSDIRKIRDYPRIPEWAQGLEEQLLGIECPLWTERVTNIGRASFLLFPRLAAAGLKGLDEDRLPWEAFREKMREIRDQIREMGLTCAPEEYWDMPEEKAEADRPADRDRIRAPEALPFVRKEERLVQLEKTERSRLEAGIPEDTVLREGDRILAEIAEM